MDRHGKVRRYFRRGGKRIKLPGLTGSTEFMGAYAEALAEAPKIKIGAARTLPGTISAMIVGYLGSAAFHGLAQGSQQQYRRILEGLRREHGDKRMAKLERRHVVKMLDAKAKTPVAARDFLRCLRQLVTYAISIGVMQDDPTAGVRVKMSRTDGFRTWSEDDIAAFEGGLPARQQAPPGAGASGQYGPALRRRRPDRAGKRP